MISPRKAVPVLFSITLLLGFAAGAQAQIYFTSGGTNEGICQNVLTSGLTGVRRVNLDGSGLTDLVTGMTRPHGIDLDVQGGKVYWNQWGTDGDTSGIGSVHRANLDGSSPEMLFPHPNGECCLEGIALDVPNGRIYTGAFGNNLTSTNFDGSGFSELTDSDSSGVTVADGRVYWTGYSEEVNRANLDFSSETTVVASAGEETRDINVDVPGGKMYWAVFDPFPAVANCVDGTGEIRRANLDGSGQETIVSGLGFPWGVALDGQGRVYWADILRGTIESVNLDGSGRSTVISGLVTPKDLVIPGVVVSRVIPTLGKWGLLITAVVLGLVALVVLRRRVVLR